MTQDWTLSAPSLGGLDAETRTLLRDSAVRKVLPRGAVLFRPGDDCVQFPLIQSGVVRVQRVTESGREIVLYRVSANEPASSPPPRCWPPKPIPPRASPKPTLSPMSSPPSGSRP